LEIKRGITGSAVSGARWAWLGGLARERRGIGHTRFRTRRKDAEATSINEGTCSCDQTRRHADIFVRFVPSLVHRSTAPRDSLLPNPPSAIHQLPPPP
jgi:hypothetical protein